MATTTKKMSAEDRFAAEQEMRQSERDLIKKYPDARIVKGTLRAGAKEGFGTKRVVDIKCRCGEVRALATSDVFHCHGRCADCIRKERNAARAERNANGKPKSKPAAKKPNKAKAKPATKKLVLKKPAETAPAAAVA